MKLIQATSNDFNRLKAFYIYVIDNSDTMKTCRWVYGKHPSDEIIMNYIKAGDMYYCEQEGEIVAAIAVTKTQTEEYHDIPWERDLADDEVTVGHMMCVDPKMRRRGIAKAMLKSVCELSRSLNKKAYRFDALLSNNPALSLYDSQGFKRVITKYWHASNTGWTDFVYYEKLL